MCWVVVVVYEIVVCVVYLNVDVLIGGIIVEDLLVVVDCIVVEDFD